MKQLAFENKGKGLISATVYTLRKPAPEENPLTLYSLQAVGLPLRYSELIKSGKALTQQYETTNRKHRRTFWSVCRSSVVSVMIASATAASAQQGTEQNAPQALLTSTEVSLSIGADVLVTLPLLNNDALARVRIREITYDSGGLPVAGFLFEPTAPGPHPAIIYNRGGYGTFGMLAPNLDFLQLVDLAAEGIVVVASQYRGTAGAPGHDGFGGEDVGDVLSLIDVLDRLESVDADRIGMMGHSRGGLMTYLTLTRTNRIRAAVVMAGPTDLRAGLEARPEMMRVYAEAIDRQGAELEIELDARSALNLVDKFPQTTPLLILHGTADWRVPPSDSIRLSETLLDRRVPFRLVMLEGGDHSMSEFELEVQIMVRDWFDRYLSTDAKLPNLAPHGP